MIVLLKKILPIFILIMMSLCYFSVSCFAGAWTSKKGNMYNKMALGYYYTDESFNANSDRESFPLNGEYKDYNLQYYVEYGLTDELTIISSLYYKRLKKEDDFFISKTSGISDIDLGLKYKLLDTRAGVLSGQGLIKIPEAYDEDDAVPLGNGQYDYEFKLLYGLSLMPKFPGYINIETGYRFRAEEPSDEWRYLLEFGMDFCSKAYGRIKLDGIKSADNGRNGVIGDNPTLSNNYELGKLDMAIGYKLRPDWSLEVSYTPEIYGEMISAGKTFSVALVYMFEK